ncbi:MAG: SAM-dependent chlorinase/fluorinase [Kosmotoga sp.]|nr:MAG: SAM-dependent chlorinase/fluorinase [Kosmotoga sp.]
MIAFMSDWGYESYYVGVAKAVIKSIKPDVEIIDITHNVKEYNIRQAAHILQRVCKDFPSQSIFLVVVDPSVGTSRKPICMKTKNDMFFVGPDNGVFSFVGNNFGVKEVRILENQDYFYGSSPTFHGRDIFAPVAAYLASGVKIRELGSLLMNYEILRYRKPQKIGDTIRGEIAYYDHFGNLETNIPGKYVEEFLDHDAFLKIGQNQYETTFCRTYFDVRPGQLLIHTDSSGFVEIAINEGNAQKMLGAKAGELLEIEKVVTNKDT